MWTRKIGVLALCGAALGMTAGCPFVDSRTSNQGGGTLLTAVDKVTTQSLGSLTPDEIQILGDTFSAVQDTVDVFITDEQAGDAVLFMLEHNINSFDELRLFIEEAQQNPDSVEIPESLLRFAESFDIEAIAAAAGV